jgi:AcrR family transcriptional regulator
MRTVDPVKYEAKRRHITESAAGCFAVKGFEKTTTADICAAAGISSGSLFHYFPNKGAVFRAIFELDGQDNAAYLATAAAAEDAWQGLLDLIDELLNPLETPGVAGLVTELVAQAGRDEELSELVVRNDLALRTGLAGLLDKAARQGRVDGSIDSGTAATWVAGLVDAMYSRATIDPGFDPAAQRVTLRLILSRFLGHGLGASAPAPPACRNPPDSPA